MEQNTDNTSEVFMEITSGKIAKQEKKFELSFPTVAEVKQVYHYLANYYNLAYEAGEGVSLGLDLGDFCSRFKLDSIKTLNALRFLGFEQSGVQPNVWKRTGSLQLLVAVAEQFVFTCNT